MNDEILRKNIKMLKALQNIKYKEIAEYLEVKECSFYAWIQGKYNFSTERKQRLQEIISTLSE